MLETERASLDERWVLLVPPDPADERTRSWSSVLAPAAEGPRSSSVTFPCTTRYRAQKWKAGSEQQRSGKGGFKVILLVNGTSAYGTLQVRERRAPRATRYETEATPHSHRPLLS
jgi:hypothetical protein